MIVPRRRLWRLFFWIALLAITVEVLGLASTFIELRRRHVGDLPGLVPDQIAAVVHLWPSLQASQRKDVLSAISGGGLSYRVTSESPVISPADAHVREVANTLRKRLGEASADSVVAIIHTRPFGREHRAINWALSNEPVLVYVRLVTGEWLVAEARGDLLPRFLGLPTGFWVGIIGMLLASGVLLVILREARAIERIAQSVEAFAATGVPQPIPIGGSPEIANLARRTARMQEQVATLFNDRNAMLGAIAHDIKTYVQRLKLRLEVLDDPNQIEKAGRDLDAMDQFVEDALLAAAHANLLRSRNTVDVLAIISHEVEAARLAGGEIVLHHLGGGPFLVQGDPVGLARAFSNIIGNSLRYGNAATVWVQQEAKAIDVTVDDNGPGIPPVERQAVFRAFYRAETSRNRSTGGTGLGLAIALGIIERQHGGSIEIADAPSGGARLRTRLPRAMGPALG